MTVNPHEQHGGCEDALLSQKNSLSTRPKQRRFRPLNSVKNILSGPSSQTSLAMNISRGPSDSSDTISNIDGALVRTTSLRHVASKSLSKERIVYDEKAEPRNSRTRITHSRGHAKSKQPDEDSTTRPTWYDSEDDLSDFIVNDSASEAELRRPPRSLRKKQAVPISRTPRIRRNIILDDDDEDGITTATDKVNRRSLTDALQELSLNVFPKAIPLPAKHCQGSDGSPSQRKGEIEDAKKSFQVHTPPASPSKPKLLSPSKARVQIPLLPHRQSIDAFWTQDVINDWNDVHSPQKTQKVKRFFDIGGISDAELSPSESPTRSMASSPRKKDKVIIEKRKVFDARKHGIAADFLRELDEVITGGQLAALSDSTGGVKIVWSRTLNSTAGRAKWQRETIRTTGMTSKAMSAMTIYQHHASIELAEKVIDDEDRLLNVVAHEFCHLANFMVSNVKDQPHGRSFKEWAARVTSSFPHKNINVTTKHSYMIDYKYVWGCADCGLEYKRHSKSLDPGRHTCGTCKGKLVQVKPVPRGTARSGNDKSTNSSGNPYQAFVKKWYATVKQEHADWKMNEIMSELARRYKIEKTKPNVSAEPAEVPGFEEPISDQVDAVVIISDDEVEVDIISSNKLNDQLIALTLKSKVHVL